MSFVPHATSFLTSQLQSVSFPPKRHFIQDVLATDVPIKTVPAKTVLQSASFPPLALQSALRALRYRPRGLHGVRLSDMSLGHHMAHGSNTVLYPKHKASISVGSYHDPRVPRHRPCLDVGTCSSIPPFTQRHSGTEPTELRHWRVSRAVQTWRAGGHSPIS